MSSAGPSFSRKKKASVLELRQAVDVANLRTARAILRGVKYRGGCSEQWARLVIMRLGTPEEKSAL